MPSIELLEDLDEKDKSRTVLYNALDNLCSASKELDFHLGTGICKPDIKLFEGTSRNRFVRQNIFTEKHLKYCEVLLISAKIPLSFYDSINKECKGTEYEGADYVMAKIEFCKRISDLLVMTNIARVGSIELSNSAIVQDDHVDKFNHIPCMYALAIQEAVNMAAQMEWPNLQAMDISTVWKWVVKRHEMLEGFDNSPMGRALNAFSRLFEKKSADEPMQLLWALVGLEAIYVTGKTEILQQVREKSQSLLGKQDKYKKKISQMYNFRSRFVHGALDFPGLFLLADARDCVAKYDEELGEAITVAIAVFVATIQEVIRRDWDGLRFEYTVHDSAMNVI